jgi:hypothetical protein
VGREGEEGYYELREVGNDGQGGWEEGGVDGVAVGVYLPQPQQWNGRSIDRSIELKAGQ